MDFASDKLVATFNPGDTIATVNIPMIDDGIIKPTEFFGLILRVEDNTDEDGRLLVTLGPENRIVATSIRDSGTYIRTYMYVQIMYECMYVRTYVCM